MNRKLLSIIIPCYNSARFINKTLDMLIDQGLEDCEVIVINDGSTDETSKIVHQYSDRYEHIKIIDKENEGVSVARNTGLAYAQGKYIYFLDSDDYLEQGTLDFFRTMLYENKGHNLYCFGYCSRKDGKLLKDYSTSRFDGVVLTGELLTKEFFLKNFFVHICSCIYERKFLNDINLHFSKGVRIGEDVEFLIRSFSRVQTAFYSSRLCFVYQIRDDSAMQGYKTFSEAQFHSYEIRRDICLSENFQKNEIRLFSNFWLQNQYVSHLISYLKSDFVNSDVTNKFIKDYEYLRLPSICGAWRNTLAIKLFKILPIRLILNLLKKYN